VFDVEEHKKATPAAGSGGKKLEKSDQGGKRITPKRGSGGGKRSDSLDRGLGGVGNATQGKGICCLRRSPETRLQKIQAQPNGRGRRTGKSGAYY